MYISSAILYWVRLAPSYNASQLIILCGVRLFPSYSVSQLRHSLLGASRSKLQCPPSSLILYWVHLIPSYSVPQLRHSLFGPPFSSYSVYRLSHFLFDPRSSKFVSRSSVIHYWARLVPSFSAYQLILYWIRLVPGHRDYELSHSLSGPPYSEFQCLSTQSFSIGSAFSNLQCVSAQVIESSGRLSRRII
jgi:hypothetical protein